MCLIMHIRKMKIQEMNTEKQQLLADCLMKAPGGLLFAHCISLERNICSCTSVFHPFCPLLPIQLVAVTKENMKLINLSIRLIEKPSINLTDPCEEVFKNTGSNPTIFIKLAIHLTYLTHHCICFPATRLHHNT